MLSQPFNIRWAAAKFFHPNKLSQQASSAGTCSELEIWWLWYDETSRRWPGELKRLECQKAECEKDQAVGLFQQSKWCGCLLLN